MYVYISCYVLKSAVVLLQLLVEENQPPSTPSAPNQTRAKTQENPFSGQDAWFMFD